MKLFKWKVNKIMPEVTYQEAYGLYACYIENFLFNKLGSRDLAEEMAQEMWFKAWRAWDHVELNNIRSWLCTIALNLWRDSMRHSRLIAFVEIDEAMQMEAQERIAEVSSLDCLSLLPANHRQAFLMHVEGFSMEELAEHFETTVPGAKMLVYRARVKLRAYYASKEVA